MKKKYLHLIILLSVYVIGYILCKFYFAQGMPLASYTAGWFYRRGFMYTWIATIVVVLMNKPYTATFITSGTFIGMIMGDLVGGLIRSSNIAKLQELIDSGVTVTAQQEAQAYNHYGVLPIWFIVFIVFVVIGIVLDKGQPRKA